MDRVLIPQTDIEKSGREFPSPAWFWAEGLNDEPVIWFRCACGQIMGLGQHTVALNGEINPSIWHDEPECGWHVHVTLEGYVQP